MRVCIIYKLRSLKMVLKSPTLVCVGYNVLHQGIVFLVFLNRKVDA